MKNRLSYLAATALSVCLIQNASGQNYTWNGAGDATTWSQGANWVGGVAPVSPVTGINQIFLGTGFPTTSPLAITIGSSDVITLADQIFGPEWGQTLNIHGTVNAGFGFAPVGAIGGPTSVVNMYGTSSYTSGDSIFLGAPFWFPGGPNVDMSLYDNSQLTTSFFAWGGHLNIFGGTVTVNNAVLSGTPTGPAFVNGLDTDATRLMNITEGILRLGGDQTAAVNDWISRGILLAYGGSGTIVIDTLSSPGQTLVTAVPEPSSLALMGMAGLMGSWLLRRRQNA